MLIPKEALKKKIGEELKNPGKCKVTGSEGGLPNIDDGYFQGIPLGGFGAGTFSQSYRGDFSSWNLEVGKHTYKHLPACQFGIYENGEAFILNDHKPKNETLSSWNFKKQNGTYSALYPTAYFEYEDLDITQEQFSPIIPGSYQETSYPVGVFRWNIKNTTDKVREVSILLSFQNILGSKENYFYQENFYSGIIFDGLHGEKNNSYGQLGAFVQNEDTEISYLCGFDETKDGSDLWDSFSKNGVLTESDDLSKRLSSTEDRPAAISAKISVNPGDNKTISFVVAWDYPIYETPDGTKWFKQYTKHFGKDGRNVTKVARKAFGENEKWLLAIKAWQEEYLNSDKPDWFKTLMLNELYYLAAGGTIWTYGKLEEDSARASRQEELFGMLECFDYPFYETLDVRFYGSFPLLKLWNKLEKNVLKNYIKAITLEQSEEKFFDHPLIQKKGKRKEIGAAPHDLGSPNEDPFLKVNAYPHGNINMWKDLNSKFVLQIYRYYFFTEKKDKDFLESAWGSIESALNYLGKFDTDGDGLIENENLPDQTFDNWVMSGPSSYCNGLYLCSLKAAIEISKILGRDSSKYEQLFSKGKTSLEEKLWNGKHYLFDTNPKNQNVLMADAMCGQWHADLLELGEVFSNADAHLKIVYETNVLKVKDGEVGAINGISTDGSMLPESEIWKENTQWNEIWTGVTLALASHLYLRGFKEESMKTVSGIYKTIDKKGYWFRTPEAWDIHGDFRASMYHRPGAIWAF